MRTRARRGLFRDECLKCQYAPSANSRAQVRYRRKDENGVVRKYVMRVQPLNSKLHCAARRRQPNWIAYHPVIPIVIRDDDVRDRFL